MSDMSILYTQFDLSLACEFDAHHHVCNADAAGDHRRPSIDHTVPDRARFVVPGIARHQQCAAYVPVQFVDVTLFEIDLVAVKGSYFDCFHIEFKDTLTFECCQYELSDDDTGRNNGVRSPDIIEVKIIHEIIVTQRQHGEPDVKVLGYSNARSTRWSFRLMSVVSSLFHRNPAKKYEYGRT
jgi:hypothetical protein